FYDTSGTAGFGNVFINNCSSFSNGSCGISIGPPEGHDPSSYPTPSNSLNSIVTILQSISYNNGDAGFQILDTTTANVEECTAYGDVGEGFFSILSNYVTFTHC